MFFASRWCFSIQAYSSIYCDFKLKNDENVLTLLANKNGEYPLDFLHLNERSMIK